MNRAPKKQEMSFFQRFYGEKINEGYNAFGKHEVTVMYEDRINEIWVCGERVDFDLPYQNNNIYEASERELRERALL